MDTAAGSLIALLLLAVALWFGIRWVIRACSKYRGTEIVTCPETGRPAVVELDALHASLTATVSLPDIRLKSCWRWPMRVQCGQECLMDLDVAPSQCLVSGVLMRWYRGKSCVYCGKLFQDQHWTDRRPALRAPEGKLVTWSAIDPEDLWNAVETHLPVCRNCYDTQTFRLDHPDLVVYRPWQQGMSGDVAGSAASRHV